MATENPLAGVAALLQTLGGQRQTTTTSPGDISALQQVFAQGQNFDPNALLQTIFQQAGGQIPGFQRAFGNAVGARSGGNSAVSAALQKLLMETSLAGQEKVAAQTLQNQQNQGQVAGSIANATKGTTSSQKTGTDMGQALKLLMMMQLAGKTGVTDKLGSIFGVGGASGGGTTGTASAPAATAPAATQSAAPAAISSPVSGGLPVGTALGAAGDIFSQPGMGSMDWTNGATLADGFASFSDMFADQANNLATMEGIDPMDALMGVTDGFGTITGGGSNFIDDLLSGIGSIFGFADGGLVGRDGQSTTDEEKIEDSVQRRFDPGNTNNQVLDLIRELMPQFADGGIVTGPSRGNRPVNTLQSANPITTGAVNSPMVQQPATRPQQQPGGNTNIGSGTTGINLSNVINDGASVGAPGTPGGNAGISQGMASAIGLGLGLLGMGPMGGVVAGMLSPNATPGSVLGNQLGAVLGLPVNAVTNAVTNTLAPTTDGQTGGGYNSTAGISAGEPGVANDFGAISSGVTGPGAVEGIDLGQLGFDLGDALGASDAAAGDNGAVGDAAAAGIGGGGMKNGGEVKGPGSGTSDSIIARLSDGEYVIPADVVDTIGVDFFDALRAAIHRPAAKMA